LWALRAVVGIPAFNEARNMRNLLNALSTAMSVDPRIQRITVVSSSTDTTNTIVREFSEADPRIQLIAERGRRGKASAWNTLIEIAEHGGFDVLVYMGADNLPSRGGISFLLDDLEGGLGIVGAHPVPVDPISNFLGWSTNLQWNMHHHISREVRPKVSGEMCALRVGVVREMPPGIINDDVYLERLFELRGFKVGYCENSKVLLRGPSTLSNMMSQRRRVYIGHHQTRMYLGEKPSTVWFRSVFLIGKALPSRGLRPYVYLVLSFFIQGMLYLIAKLDLYRGNLPYKWKMAETTKLLKYGI
jgi:glycosyltransferase involved in cell wall biosynthesis